MLAVDLTCGGRHVVLTTRDGVRPGRRCRMGKHVRGHLPRRPLRRRARAAAGPRHLARARRRDPAAAGDRPVRRGRARTVRTAPCCSPRAGRHRGWPTRPPALVARRLDQAVAGPTCRPSRAGAPTAAVVRPTTCPTASTSSAGSTGLHRAGRRARRRVDGRVAARTDPRRDERPRPCRPGAFVVRSVRAQPLRSLTFSVAAGRTVCRSPTTPKSTSSKIGASGSLLTATIVFDVCMPARCWIAPEMPLAT